MKLHHYLITLLFAAFTSFTIFSCQGNGAAGGANANGDSIDWNDSAHVLTSLACDYYNNNQEDSLEMIIPTILKLCKEHGLTKRYYKAWAIPVELYFWTTQFDKGIKEAQKMQDEALKEQCSYGLFEANRLLGNGYMIHGSVEEGINCLNKALGYVSPDSVEGNVPEIYGKLISGLHYLKRYEQEDSVLQVWKSTLDRYYAKMGKENPEVFGNWYLSYQSSLADYLLTKGKHDAAALAVDSMEYYARSIGADDPLTQSRIISAKSKLAYEQGDYAAALRLTEQRQQMAEAYNENSDYFGALQLKSETLERMGRYQEALKVLRQQTAFTDSLTEVDNHQLLNDLNKRFEVNELKMEKERQQMQAERRQLYLVIAIILLILAAVVVIAILRRRADRRMAAMRAAQERIENELKIARDIQMSMVPSQFPDYEGLDMYASMTPAKEVGGDLYGYLLQDDKLYFCVGDVSGKGVPASLFMAQATRLFRTLAAQQMMPAEICTRMNDALSGEDNESSMFVTLFLGLLDLKTGHLDLCNCGHNPPVIGSGQQEMISDKSPADGACHFIEMIPNAPIGLFPGLDYEGETIDNIKGNTIFIYTDGLNEAENRQQAQFGDDRLLTILSTIPHESAQQVVDTLKAEVERHRDGAEPNDDLTMMCIMID